MVLEAAAGTAPVPPFDPTKGQPEEIKDSQVRRNRRVTFSGGRSVIEFEVDNPDMQLWANRGAQPPTDELLSHYRMQRQKAARLKKYAILPEVGVQLIQWLIMRHQDAVEKAYNLYKDVYETDVGYMGAENSSTRILHPGNAY